MTLVFLAVAERESLPFLGMEISRRALAATGAGLLGGAGLALGIVGTQYAAGLLVLSSNPPALATGEAARASSLGTLGWHAGSGAHPWRGR